VDRFRQLELLEVPTATDVRQMQQRPPVEVQEVEDQVGQARRRRVGVGQRHQPAWTDAELEGLEARLPASSQGDQLAVQDGAPGGEPGGERFQLGNPGGVVAVSPAEQPPPTAVDVEDGAIAVPFVFEAPTGARGQPVR
jgi:hypothetical protein